MTNSIFVYGSLCSGMPHESRIAQFVDKSQPAFAFGTLFRSPSGMPMMHPDGQQKITGELCELKSLESAEPILDQLLGFNPQNPEKSVMLRVGHAVSLKEAEMPIMAQCYIVNPKRITPAMTVIEGGDWKKSWQERPPIVNLLTDAQRSYIQKLGNCSGRDIVPINLTMYRELISLELVIDKGRRLALTPLGQEICRQL